MSTTMQKISIEKVAKSKIDQVDFDNLAFGSVFTDHMLVCDYKNGAWETPKIIPYQPISLDPSAKIFHYGQSIFEGMKAYKDTDSKVWLFRPLDNHKRLNISAKRMAIPEVPEEYFMEDLRPWSNSTKIGFRRKTEVLYIYVLLFLLQAKGFTHRRPMNTSLLFV